MTLQLYHKSLNDPIFRGQNLTQTAKNLIYKLTKERRNSELSKLQYERERRDFSFRNFRKVESTNRV